LCSSIPHTKPRDLGRTLSAALPPVLAPGARVVTESNRRAACSWTALLDERRYGDTLIRIHDSDNRIAICPGTFDPITHGHLDVISARRRCTTR